MKNKTTKNKITAEFCRLCLRRTFAVAFAAYLFLFLSIVQIY